MSISSRNSFRPQDRSATHDGHIWPLPRCAMTHTKAIRRRMADEVRGDIHRAGADAIVTKDDFRRRGWSEGQITDHAAAAIDLATAGMRRDAA